MKKALVFGANGQTGSYLCEFLLNKDYEVYAVVRRTSTPSISNIEHLKYDDRFTIVSGDVTDFSSIQRLISDIEPDEVYNLAAQSHVGESFAQPIATWEITAQGVLNILEAIKPYGNAIKFLQASSSEMFGNNRRGDLFIDETTPFSPQSPYAIAKVAAHQAVGLYRKSYGMHASCSICFNHESPRRGLNFVTRKITNYIGQTVANIEQHLSASVIEYVVRQPTLKLGNISSCRDWGFAGDYVHAMWLMLQQEVPDDYVIATGQTWSVKDFIKIAFEYAKLDQNIHVEVDQDLFRPSEVFYLKGDASKAKRVLGWQPTVSFDELVKMMVDSDVAFHRKKLGLSHEAQAQV